MEKDGDLADIVLRASGGGGGGAVGDSGNQLNWSSPNGVVSFPSPDNFGNPFSNMQDPLHEAAIPSSSFFNPSDEYTTAPNNTTLLLPKTIFDEDLRRPTNNIFSRMLQISPKNTISPSVAQASCSSAGEMITSNTSTGSAMESIGMMQISSSRNLGIKRRAHIICIGMDHRPSQMSYTDLLNEVDSNMIVRNLSDTFAQENETPPTTPNSTTSKKPSSRGTSFSAHEDMLIVSAWLNISQDAIVGNEQRQGSYWQRIYEYYSTHKNIESNRTKSAIRNRWGVISAAVSKFCGCVSQIERLHQSGVTENDKINSARVVYADNNKAQFNMDHCWNVLRYEQKWVHSLESPKKR